jgi:putative hemolysin
MDTFEIPTAALTLILVIFISFSGFFSAAETALTGANKLRLKNLAKGGNTRARKALQLLNHFDDALSTILIGNNVVNIATASLRPPSPQRRSVPRAWPWPRWSPPSSS